MPAHQDPEGTFWGIVASLLFNEHKRYEQGYVNQFDQPRGLVVRVSDY